MRSQTRHGTAVARTTGDIDIHRPANVVDLEHYRAQSRPADARTTVRVDIDADGLLHYEIHIRREDADRVTDALLLALLAAREARAECGATSIGNRGNVNE
jgi:hypothetical protein